ncbi:MAG TPA: PRC-barrel domain-containing protein, partial [Rubrobacteraceae bacterium]|nr:PRC-barrel domain-containing protein [Rubrobacteraceae bacterium]
MSRARKRGEKGGTNSTQNRIEGAIDNIRGRIEEATGSASGDRGETTEGSGDRIRESQESYEGYEVYDRRQEEIGKVDELFVGENDQPEYIGVRTGLLGTKLTLIPMEITRVNDRRRLIEVSADKDVVNDAPSFDEGELTAEYEDRVYRHFGLERAGSANYPSDTPGERSPGY